ncbi:MAG: ABC transporter substrate-binding protein [Clostridiales bacterium]|nr:ABC transporter substrate-binding protein [Clostridiales bacterium]
MFKKLTSILIFCALLLPLALAEGAPSPVPGLVWQDRLPLDYAEGFTIDRFEGGYRLIDIAGGETILIVPEGADIPEGHGADIVVLEQPVDDIYLAATSAMALFDRLGALDHIAFSSLEASRWSIEGARTAMDAGDIVYAGKYSEPDYETLVLSHCDLAIESTMIEHAPKVREMIELLGIPVIVDRSSYESHPLGRTEWIKLYGAITGHEDEAEEFFAQAERAVKAFESRENTGLTVAFFYVNQDGSVVVRAANDYIPRMIELAGGKYALRDVLDPDSTRSSETISMETFYAAARDADYLIYYTSIASPLGSLDDLKRLSPLFADFKAVSEGRVYTTGTDLYQETDRVSDLIVDLGHMFSGEGDMQFLSRIE